MIYRRLIFIVCLILFYSNALPQGFLKTKGQKIINDVNDDVLLRGIGLGGWLVQEGYMLGTSEFANAEHEIKAKIKELLTEEQFNNYYTAYYQNYVNEKDIDKIGEWGFNSIRIPLHYDKLTLRDQPGVYLEEGFKTIDNLLAWCKKNEIYLILDLHAAPGGQSDEPISDYDSRYPSLWESESNKQRTIDLWAKIAERYKDEEWIGGYDLINEPKWQLGDKNEQLRDLYIKITNAIRTVDKNHILFIEGNWYATDFNGLDNHWDDNMAYSFHKYWNANDVGAIQYLLSLRQKEDIPLWVGESGENSNSWFKDCITLLENNNIGWSWWPHKKISAIAGPLSAYKSDKYNRLLEYWKGHTSKPTNEYAYNALMEQAEYLKIEYCAEQYGVIDAMFRQINDNATLPKKNVILPGKIFCSDYDYGPRGYAWADKDYENIGGGAYNSGYVYRNDGVDLEACSDSETNGYNVGWINSGEWLKYTINFDATGTYKVSLRVAGYSNNGKARLKLNDISISNFIDIPSTGGWQTWKTVDLGEFEFIKGKSTITIQFFGDSFNINYLNFDLITDVTENGNTSLIEDYLFTPFPNPFNSQTNITFSLANSAKVNVKVYNITGQVINEFNLGNKSAGKYNIKWDAKAVNSGVYFVNLTTSKGYSKTEKILLVK